MDSLLLLEKITCLGKILNIKNNITAWESLYWTYIEYVHNN